MITSRQRLLFVEMASIVAPLVLVYVARTVLATSAPVSIIVPVSAPALDPVPVVAIKAMSPEQHKAAEWIRQLPKTLALESPLNHPVEVVIVKRPEIDPSPMLPAQLPRESPINGLKLTAVLGNDDGKLAAINGKIFRIGDEVRPRLRLTDIDARNSLIMLTHVSGETYTLKRELELK